METWGDFLQTALTRSGIGPGDERVSSEHIRVAIESLNLAADEWSSKGVVGNRDATVSFETDGGAIKELTIGPDAVAIVGIQNIPAPGRIARVQDVRYGYFADGISQPLSPISDPVGANWAQGFVDSYTGHPSKYRFTEGMPGRLEFDTRLQVGANVVVQYEIPFVITADELDTAIDTKLPAGGNTGLLYRVIYHILYAYGLSHTADAQTAMQMAMDNERMILARTQRIDKSTLGKQARGLGRQRGYRFGLNVDGR